MSIQPGRYRHYKGNIYDVIGVAKHTETSEELVVYRDVNDAEKLWVRPAVMFSGVVDVDRKKVRRFEKI